MEILIYLFIFLIISSIPLLIHYLRNIEVIAWTTLVFGILLYFVDKFKVTKKFDEDLVALNSFYKDEGHRDFNVLSDSVFYNKKKRGLVVQITVNEGAQYKFRNFSWEGNSLYEEQILQTTLNLKKGDIFNQSGFDKAVYQDVQSLYMDRGYLYRNIEPFFTPTDNDSIDLHFSFT